MLVDRRRQARVPPVSLCLLTVCLHRRFMDPQGPSSQVSLSKERAQLHRPTLKPSPPETTAPLYKQGPCCVGEKTTDTQLQVELISLGFDTLLQAKHYWRLPVASRLTTCRARQKLPSDPEPVFFGWHVQKKQLLVIIQIDRPTQN